MSGKVLKEIRVEAGITQGDVADVLGVSVAYVSQLERGRRPLHALTPDLVALLCDALGLEDGDGRLYEACIESFGDTSPWAAELRRQVFGLDGEEGDDDNI